MTCLCSKANGSAEEESYVVASPEDQIAAEILESDSCNMLLEAQPLDLCNH